MFGGLNANTHFSDTWEWNGSAWTDVTPASGNPDGRVRSSMAFDVVLGQVVMVGGYNPFLLGAYGDTWLWTGSAWTNVTPSSGNPIRHAHSLVLDPLRGRVVLFGGYESGYSDETWEWNGSAWTSVTATPPPSRYDFAIATDVARGRITMFGGSHRNDTWEWTGAAWQDVTPSAGNPTGRYNHALAYDLARRRSVLFGGRGTAGRFADTWEWDGSGWSDKTPVSGNPGARDDHALAYDAERRCSVLFGGYGGPGIGFFDDTWCWDGSAWANVTPASGRPPARSGTALAYDSAR
jgi:hypothetical protein